MRNDIAKHEFDDELSDELLAVVEKYFKLKVPADVMGDIFDKIFEKVYPND